jgi:hypothetical protein
MSLSRLCSALTLSSVMLLSSCMSRISHEPEDQAQVLVQTFVKQLAAGNREGILELVSTPFWSDKWVTKAEDIRKNMPSQPEAGLANVSKIEIRIYPIEDLAALSPETWEAIKTGSPEALQDLYVAAVGLYLKGNPEDGLLLLRRVNGVWRLAGLIEE